VGGDAALAAPARRPRLAQVQGPGLGRALRRAGLNPLLLVGGLTVLGLLLRLPSFDDSLYGDELATYYVVTDHSLGDVVHLLQGNSPTGDLSPPLFFMVAWLTEGLFGHPESLRIASLLAGLAAIPLTYLLGLRTVGRPAALLGATLIALSPFLIYYTTEARAYGLTLLLVLLSTLALLRALDGSRFWWWAAYAVCSCAAVYTHYTPVYLLGAQFLWAFLARPDARLPLIAANAAAAVAYLPWVPTLIDNTNSPGAKVIGFLSPFTLSAVRIDLGRWGLGQPYIPLRDLPGWFGIAMFLAGSLAGVAGLLLRLRRAATGLAIPRPSSRTVLIFVLALATPAGLIISSLIGDSVWTSRNLISSWPGLALAVGAIVTAPAGLLRIVSIGLVVAAFGIGAVKMLDADNQRPQYAEAAAFIENNARPGDPIVESPIPTPGPFTPLTDVALANLDEPAPESHPALRLGYPALRSQLRVRPYTPLPVASAETVARRAARLARGRRLFVVSAGPDAIRTLVLKPFRDALPEDVREVESRSFRGLIPVQVDVFRGAGG
jgi:mannosyltransferase